MTELQMPKIDKKVLKDKEKIYRDILKIIKKKRKCTLSF